MADHLVIHGLHHVTAIASGAQANLDFYTRVLGLRLVKRTVNFDAPDTYHFYYGDERGSPVSHRSWNDETHTINCSANHSSSVAH